MKYIIIPVSKFIWAIFLTIVCSVPIAIFIIAIFLWEFKFTAEDLEFEAYLISISPYWSVSGDYTKITSFKSYYHYIWGIPKEINKH